MKEEDENALLKGAFSRGLPSEPAPGPSGGRPGPRFACRERRHQRGPRSRATPLRLGRAELWAHWALRGERWRGRGCPGTSLASVCLCGAFTQFARGRSLPVAGSRVREGLGERLAERVALAREGCGAALGPGVGGGKILPREKPGVLQ